VVVYFAIDGWLNEPYARLDIGSIGTTFRYLAQRRAWAPSIWLQPDAPASLFRSERELAGNLPRFA
jgi:hypothetical protein